MAHKKTDRNARKALNEFKYEMSGELGVNELSNNYKANSKKSKKAARNKMDSNNKH